LALVVSFWLTPVSSLVTMMAAPGMTAPLLSTTVPEMRPFELWPNAPPAATTPARMRQDNLDFMQPTPFGPQHSTIAG
jgi:hypothetical protein